MGPSKCKICNEAQIKYKCSTCLTPYCSSSACLKKHKDTWRHRYMELRKWNELKPAARKEVVNWFGERWPRIRAKRWGKALDNWIRCHPLKDQITLMNQAMGCSNCNWSLQHLLVKIPNALEDEK